MFNLLKEAEFSLPANQVEKKASKWNHLVLGTMFVALGVIATVIGTASIRYRLTNIVLDNLPINGRIVRLTSPTNGSIEAFYASAKQQLNRREKLSENPPMVSFEKKITQEAQFQTSRY